MHPSSMDNMQKAYKRYVCNHNWDVRKIINVVDIGGSNVNGTYADIFSERPFTYLAADIKSGTSVDIVIEDPYNLPFEDRSVDLLISGQVFEHVEFFWSLFKDMCRIVKEDGLIIIIIPSGGPIHKYPVDCYRFYPDALKALAKYADCYLVDFWHDDLGPWNDLVGIFSKQNIPKYQQGEISHYNSNWKINRYEKESLPRLYINKNKDKKTEIKKGTVHYYKILEKMQNKLNPELYLEIGVRNGESLSLSKGKAIAVDPYPDIKIELDENKKLFEMNSDEFFEYEARTELQSHNLDLAFIDGMHLFEYALRDFINIEQYSNPNTVIVVDDVLPNHILQSSRIRKTQVWTGDVWKLPQCLKTYRKDLVITLLDTSPTGLLVIKGLDRNNKKLKEAYNPIVRKYQHMELEGEMANNVMSRADSIDPLDPEFWSSLPIKSLN